MYPSNPKPVVLVVEDEPILRELSVYELQHAGYKVLEAGNADARYGSCVRGAKSN